MSVQPRLTVLRSKKEKENVKKKKTARKRPAWDDTVQDLNVYKATPDEIVRRRLVHASQNVDALKAEKLKTTIRKARGRNLSQNRQKNHLLREILDDEEQLSDVFVRSDKVLDIVRDVFKGDPKKYHSMPHITMAPNGSRLENSFLPDGRPLVDLEGLDLLSDTVMDKSALNDLQSDCEDSSELSEVESVKYEAGMDLSRFRKLLDFKEDDEGEEKGSVQSSAIDEKMRRARQLLISKATRENVNPAKQTKGEERKFEAESGNKTRQNVDNWREGIASRDNRRSAFDAFVVKRNVGSSKAPVTPEPSSPKELAINDTSKIKKHLARTNYKEECPEEGSPSTTLTSVEESREKATLADLKRVLDGLRTSADNCERQSNKRTTSAQLALPVLLASQEATAPQSQAPPSQETFASYATAMAETVTRLANYLKQSDMQLRAEITLREQLQEDLSYLRTVVDGLTTDIIVTQEEFAKLLTEYAQYRQNTERQFVYIKDALEERGISFFLVPFKQTEIGSKGSVNGSVQPNFNGHGNTVQGHSPFRDDFSLAMNNSSMNMSLENPPTPYGKQQVFPTAVLLTPPRQMDSINRKDISRNLPHYKPDAKSNGIPVENLRHLNSGENSQKACRETLVPLPQPVSQPGLETGSNRIGNDSATALDREQLLVRQELARLNQQYAEAQEKFQTLVQRQRSEDLSHKMSPSVSPISRSPSTTGCRRNEEGTLNNLKTLPPSITGRELNDERPKLKISLPQVQYQRYSGGSGCENTTTSGAREDVGYPNLRILSSDTSQQFSQLPQPTEDGGCFALSKHVPVMKT